MNTKDIPKEEMSKKDQKWFRGSIIKRCMGEEEYAQFVERYGRAKKVNIANEVVLKKSWLEKILG